MPTNISIMEFIFGRLSWESLAFLHEPILMVTFVVVAIGGAAILGTVTYFKRERDEHPTFPFVIEAAR